MRNYPLSPFYPIYGKLTQHRYLSTEKLHIDVNEVQERRECATLRLNTIDNSPLVRTRFSAKALKSVVYTPGTGVTHDQKLHWTQPYSGPTWTGVQQPFAARP